MTGYSDSELTPLFEGIKAGSTIIEATERAGMDHRKVNESMNDIAVRRHMLDCSTTYRNEVKG
jgi:hypothetical protein